METDNFSLLRSFIPSFLFYIHYDSIKKVFNKVFNKFLLCVLFYAAHFVIWCIRRVFKRVFNYLTVH